MNDSTNTPPLIKWPADFSVNLEEPLAAAGLSPEQIEDFNQLVLTFSNIELIKQAFKYLPEESKQRIRLAISSGQAAAVIESSLISEYASVQDDSKPTFEQLVDNSKIKAITSNLLRLKQSANPEAFAKVTEYLATATKTLQGYN